jgi:hypothetical protein
MSSDEQTRLLEPRARPMATYAQLDVGAADGAQSPPPPPPRQLGVLKVRPAVYC